MAKSQKVFEEINGVKVDVTECERQRAASAEANSIGNFLDWLNLEQGIKLMRYHTHDENCETAWDETWQKNRLTCEEGWFPVGMSNENLLAKYFDIDLNKVDRERNKLLEALSGGQ